MAQVFDSFSNAYLPVFKKALRTILEEGKEVKPRGQLTKEISPAMMVVDPLHCFYASPLRKLNFAFMMAENLWYLSGRADVCLLAYYNSQIAKYSADSLMDGAYGPKIISQIRYVVETLQSDSESRQAIISIWERNPKPSKDVPCTIAMQFMIRDRKLNAYVMMRSNDIIFGSNYDIPSFSHIQMVVASCLGLDTGFLYLTANSLHLYETHFKLAKDLLDESVVLQPERLGAALIPPKMKLEDHVKAIDQVVAIEGAIRHRTASWYEMFDIDPFYKQYVLMFDMYEAIKRGDEAKRNSKIKMLLELESPLGKIYAHRYGLFSVR